jgi:hypothetical protein
MCADLFFAVDLKELPQSRFEVKKVKFVHFYLENVTSNSPAVTLIVEHSDRYSSKLPSEQVIETVLRLRRATALSGSVPPNFEGSDYML